MNARQITSGPCSTMAEISPSTANTPKAAMMRLYSFSAAQARRQEPVAAKTEAGM